MRGLIRPGISLTALLLSFCFAGAVPARLVDRILAVVNGEIITMTDVQDYQTLFLPDADLQTVMEELIDQKLLSAEARKFGQPLPSQKSVDEDRGKLAERKGGSSALVNLLNRLSLTENDLTEMIKNRILANQLLDQQVNFFVFVSGREIDDYLQSHPEEFSGMTTDEARRIIQDRLARKKSETRRRDYIRRLRDRAVIRIN
jgi:peptidyl-prolyl cis-trans isomerase SurA